MADWTKISSRGNVDDRRGRPMGFAGGGLGLAVVGIVLLMNMLSGQQVDVGDLLGQLNQVSSESTLTSKDFDGVDDYERFTATVLGSNNDVWRQHLKDEAYVEPNLVLFRSATRSACPALPSTFAIGRSDGRGPRTRAP